MNKQQASESGSTAEEKHQTTNKQKKKQKNFLVVYGFSLLSIALVLVLFSFFGQIRASEQTIADLLAERENSSISAMKNIQDLENENTQLQTENKALKKSNEEQASEITRLELQKQYLEKENGILEDRNNTEGSLYKERLAALEVVFAVNQLYAERYYSFASYKIVQMEDGATDYLQNLFADTDFLTSEKTSPISKAIYRYVDVRDWLQRRGHLQPEKVEEWAKSHPELVGDGN